MRRRQPKLLLAFFDNSFVHSGNALALNNRRALLGEGADTWLLEELAEIGRRKSRPFYQRFMLKDFSWTLLGRMNADVITLEETTRVLVICCALVLLPQIGCCIVRVFATQRSQKR